VAAAEAVAAQISVPEHALRRPGRPLDRREPFFIGMSATAGVAVMLGLADMVITARDVLILIGLALFLAIGLESAVSLPALHRFTRWSAVLIVLVSSLGRGRWVPGPDRASLDPARTHHPGGAGGGEHNGSGG